MSRSFGRYQWPCLMSGHHPSRDIFRGQRRAMLVAQSHLAACGFLLLTGKHSLRIDVAQSAVILVAPVIPRSTAVKDDGVAT